MPRPGLGVVALSLSGLMLFAYASAAAEPAVGAGVGTYACSEYTRATSNDEGRALAYFSWAQGWMTAWNLGQMDAGKPTRDLSQPSIADQRAFVQAYCGQHPDELYMKAVYALYASLRAMGAPAK